MLILVTSKIKDEDLKKAAEDLDGILDWISRDSPRAAAELVRRILARIERLRTS